MSKQLNIRSDEAYAAATRLAQRLGTTTTDAVLRALRRLEQETYKPVAREELTPEEASTYLRTLRGILRAIEVSDADMEKGQFRCDANVSVRPKGQAEFGTRAEIKNVNSFRFVERAIN